MDECLSENQIAELLSGTARDDHALRGHLDRCSTCLGIVAMALRSDLPVGGTRFAILRRIGEGGMGTVYEALDRERTLRVALKVLRNVGPDTLLRFKREFRILQDLHHPNLVRLGELAVEGDCWFFTMELIEGVPFLPHVRPASDGLGFDEARLRDGFRQLVQGLGALHATGKIHRDVKPSNILVTHHGRVVLLDLGLVLDQYGENDSASDYMVGTIAYMAPEQSLGKRVGPAADWYATGVVLYQALTGQLPFTGNPLEILADKQQGRVVAPRTLVPASPTDLNALCLSLLQPDAGERPTADAILRMLGSDGASAPVLREARRTPTFVGRSHELDVLARALEETHQGRPVAVFVSGESGIGKSALVRHFADECQGRGIIVLAGRCYERESVPFKALDGIVDALSRYLARLPVVEAAAMLPRHVALLARAFPVLSRVESIAEAPHGLEVRDPHELRIRLLGALRELLARLADRHTIMLVIDDAHWADTDSFALLAELFRPPDAPALLLVATVRGSAGTVGNTHLAVARNALAVELRELRLAALSAADARALAALLIERQPGRSDLDAAAVAKEASGHPLFIDELVRHCRADGSRVTRLDDALWTRITELAPPAREILQLAALAGGPLVQGAAARAARLDGNAFEDHLKLLRVVNLVRTTGTSVSDHLEPYHDRVRAAVLAHTGDAEARVLHRQLALAFEAEPQADAEALALHWRETGEYARAAEYAAKAAALASHTLAFDRSAQLYRLALELRAAVDPTEEAFDHSLRVKLGHALVNANRGAEAANVYLDAAHRATASDAMDLRRRASEQLMRNGHIDEAIATLRTALQPLGIKVASTQRQALRSLIFRRVQLRLRGLRYRERDPADLPARTLVRIDFCWSLSASFSFVDPMPGIDLATLHVLMALRAGERTRVCRALATEAVYAASVGAARRTQRLLARAQELADRISQPYVSGILTMCRGMASALLGRFAEACRLMQDAQRILRGVAAGVSWELSATQVFELEVLGWMGHLGELAGRVPAAKRAAKSRGDLYFSTELHMGLLNLVWLQRDDVDQARRETTEALERWDRPGFQVANYWDLYAQVQIDLYRGDGEAAYARMAEQWSKVEGSMMMRMPYFRIAICELYARSALAAARQRVAASPKQAHALVAETRRNIKRLRRERMPWADALAWLLQAGAARLRADDAEAIDCLVRAVDGFAAVDMELFASAARGRLAELRGGRDGLALADEVAAWFARHEVKAPAQMIAMLTPAF